jgi:dTDP-4-dehydrorhamnose 3,5-epimerase
MFNIPIGDRGQLNFAHVNCGGIKAWHMHKEQTDIWVVTRGDLKCVCYKDGDAREYYLGEHQPSYLVIPPGWWHGLKVLGDDPVDMIYYVNRKYDSDNPDEERKPYDWVDPTNWIGKWWEVQHK